MARNDLEERLINFAVAIIVITRSMDNSFASEHLSMQITRSSSSAALNYGEVQGAESRRDFIHKMKIVLKELRETHVNLKIIFRANLSKKPIKIEEAIKESHELVSIFMTFLQTARRNQAKNLKDTD